MAIHDLIGVIIEYYKKPKWIEHSLKVFAYAQGIGGGENLSDQDQLILEAAALLHDVGIPPALLKFSSAAGEFQEQEGAAATPGLLEKAGLPASIQERVAWLVGHHHTEDLAPGDRVLQILMEADYLVNLVEGNVPDKTPQSVNDAFFKTATGKRYLRGLFPGDKA